MHKNIWACLFAWACIISRAQKGVKSFCISPILLCNVILHFPRCADIDICSTKRCDILNPRDGDPNEICSTVTNEKRQKVTCNTGDVDSTVRSSGSLICCHKVNLYFHQLKSPGCLH